MKLFVASFLLAAVAADRLENTYLPPGNAPSAGGNGNFLSAPSTRYLPASSGAFDGRSNSQFRAAPSSQYGAPARNFGGSSIPSAQYGAPGKSAEARASILRFNNENLGDGSYRFEYETENKISQQESGELKHDGSQEGSQSVQGSYSYLGDDGKTYTVHYVADENGFRPVGEHIAEAVQTLAKNAAAEAQSYNRDAQSQGFASQQRFAPSLSQQSGYQY